MPILVKRGLILVGLFLAWLLVDTLLTAMLGRAGGFASLLVAAYFVYACWQAWKPKPVPPAAPTPPAVVAPTPEPPVDTDPAVR